MTMYRPGRSLRTTSTAKLQSYAIWLGWGLACGLAINALALGAAAWIVVAGVPLGYAALVKSRVRDYDLASRHGLAALTQGNAAIAERELSLVRDRFRWPRFLPRLTDYNRANALIRQGRHAEAIALLSDVDAKGGVINVDGAIASTLAYAHALLGNVELGQLWLEEAKRRYARYSKVPPFASVMSDITVGLRAGQAREVATQLDNDWTQLENSLTGERLRPLRVLRAFAIAQSSTPREAGAVEAVIASLRAARTDDLMYLAVAWPELHQFMVASRLAPTG